MTVPMSSKAAPPSRAPAAVAGRVWFRVAVPMAVFALIAGVTLATHLGAHSPYTWGFPVLGVEEHASQIDGLHVNPDSLKLRVVQLTEGFFLPCGIDIQSANVAMPMHSFFVAIVLGFARHYMLASIAANMLALLALMYAFTRTCLELELPVGATILAGANALLLPWVAHYLSQPLHYTFAVSLNFLVALAIVRLAQRGDRSPWVFGILAATMTVNYDWYVFVPALGLFLLFFHRFERKLDYAKFAVVAVAPLVAWKALVAYASNGSKVNDQRGTEFFIPVREAWTTILKGPVEHALEPFVISHIGLDLAVRMTIGLVYWPLLVVVIFLVLRQRPSLKAHPWAWFPILVVLVFVAEQMGTGAFDWENNPRRALPVVFAFSVALTFAVAQIYASRAWRAAFVGLAALSFVLTFSDRIMKNPVVQMLEMGEDARAEPKWPMKMYAKRLTLEATPILPVDAPTFTKFESKCPLRKADTPGAARAPVEFWLSQLLLGGVLAGLVASFRRLRWLPKHGPAVLAALFALSLLARFWS